MIEIKNRRGGQNAVLHDFGVGEPMSIKEFRELYAPILSARSIRHHLAAGRTTRAQMLAFDGNAAHLAGSRKGAATGRAGGFMWQHYARLARMT